MQQLKAIIQMSRPLNCLITFLSVIAAGYLASGFINNIYIFIAGASGFLTAAAGNIINDVFDVEIDRINKPHRPMPSGKINKFLVLNIYMFINLVALILAAIININTMMIVVVTVFVMYFYSFLFKKIVLFGNFVIAVLTGLAFIFGGFAVGNYEPAIIPALFAFQINFIREIVKDIEDVKGDFANQVYTFSVKAGFRNTLLLIYVLVIILIAGTSIPYLLGIYNIEYYILVMITVNVLLVYFLKLITTRRDRASYKKAGNVLKIAMLFGLFSIIVGVM